MAGIVNRLAIPTKADSSYLNNMQLRGCGTALVTPFHQDGSIDDAALRWTLSQQASQLCDGRGAERVAEALLGLLR